MSTSVIPEPESFSPSSSDHARLLAAASPASFAHLISQGRWVPYEHLILLNDHLMRLAAGELTRLIVTMPPRHGKSELVSRYLPAWYLGRFPDRQVILASYGKDIAADHSERARELLAEWGPPVFGINVSETSAAASRWRVKDHDGVMIASGLRGGITGRGAHLLIIDDPIKDELEAQSQLKRDRVWNWWQSTASTRLMPGNSAVVIVQTRWHEDDLSGRLLGESDRWTLLNLPALAEPDDLLDRAEGEALCPELFDEDDYTLIKAEKGSYFFAAMYQQRPAPSEGVMFKRSHFRYYRELEEHTGAIYRRWYVIPKEGEDGDRRIDAGEVTVFQTVDVAISERSTADWTVVATWAATAANDLLLLDLDRQHFEEQEIARFLMRCADKHDRPPMWVESFGAGRSPLASLRREGYPVMELPAEAGTKLDKVTRAFGAVSAYEAHRVFHPYPYPVWLEAFEGELIPFPNAAHDDQVDVVSYAARLLPMLGGRQRVVQPKGRTSMGNTHRRRW